jgi:xanthine dehydrogenase accessory factor
MNNQIDFYKALVNWMGEKPAVVMATVISLSGSGPREPGAAMLIDTNANTVGTVGGGALEAHVMKDAESVFRENRPLCKTYRLTNQQASDIGMLCGGTVEILIDYLRNTTHGKLFKHILSRLESNQSVVRMTSIYLMDEQVTTCYGFASGDFMETGALDMTGIDQTMISSKIEDTLPSLLGDKTLRYFFQPLKAPDRAYIVGAGHVGEALAPVCAHVGFVPTVIDDREEFANKNRFPSAENVLVIDTYENCLKNVSVNETGYIVIVTRGHAHDQTVLSHALKTDAAYIGMIGSKRKRNETYAALKEQGYSDTDLDRVHCPVGLDIGAQTPAEIAVSIVAEMIAVRAGR